LYFCARSLLQIISQKTRCRKKQKIKKLKNPHFAFLPFYFPYLLREAKADIFYLFFIFYNFFI